MTSRAKKNTRVRKTPGADKTERLIPAIEQAQALLDAHEKGPQPNSANPFVQKDSRDTIAQVANAIDYLTMIDEDITLTTDMKMGRMLILQTLSRALAAADVQIRHERERSHARGVLEGVKAGAQ